MAKYIKREVAVKAANEWVSEACVAPVMRVSRLFDKLQKVPAADVAPIEALERLWDELCAQDLITMEGLRKLNTLIWKYTTAHDGGADHEAGAAEMLSPRRIVLVGTAYLA